MEPVIAKLPPNPTAMDLITSLGEILWRVESAWKTERDDLRDDNDRLRAALKDAKDALNASGDVYESRMDEMDTEVEDLKRELTAVYGERDLLNTWNADLRKKYEELKRDFNQVGSNLRDAQYMNDMLEKRAQRMDALKTNPTPEPSRPEPSVAPTVRTLQDLRDLLTYGTIR